MEHNLIRRKATVPKVLTNNAERAERLLCTMRDWWDGCRVVEIAHEHGISRQRMYALLASVGCHWRLRRQKRVSRYADPTWRPPAEDVARARAMVEHMGFRRLTVRQRGAVAWRASGLNLPEISERLGSYPSVTRDTLMAAYWRMEQLMWKAEHGSRRRLEPDPLLDIGPFDIEELLGPKHM